MNPIKQHIFLHKECFPKNSCKNIFLIFFAPVLEILFPALVAIYFLILNSENFVFLSYNFHSNPITIPSAFLLIMLIRTALIQKLNRIKYDYCIEISHRLALDILRYARELNFKKLYQVDTKKLSTVANIETQQLIWRYFLPLVDLYIETGILIILIAYFCLIEEYLVCFILILAFGFIFLNTIMRDTNKNTTTDKRFDPEDEIRFQIETFYSILRDGKFTLLQKANGIWLFSKVESKYGELKEIITVNITRSANLKYLFEFLMLTILMGLFILYEQDAFENLIAKFILLLRAGYSVVRIRSITINLELTKNIAEMFIKTLSELKANRANNKENTRRDMSYVISKSSSSKILLKLNDLQVGYGQQALVNIPNGEFQAGDIVSLVGPSGSGKTTFIHTLIGALEPISGSVNISNVRDIKGLFYLSPQNSILLPDTLINNLYLGEEVSQDYKSLFAELGFNRERIDELLGSKNIFNEVSGGEAKKIEAVRCALNSRDSQIIILDELDSALDGSSKLLLGNFIKKNFSNKLIIFITHDNNFRSIIAPDHTITLVNKGKKN